MSTRTLAALLISGFALSVSGCSVNRAASLRMLDQRAEYDQTGAVPGDLALKEGGIEGFRESPVPVRTRPKVAAIWIHPHETAGHDYFWGGWLSIVIENDQWVLTKPGLTPKAPVIQPVGMTAKKKRK